MLDSGQRREASRGPAIGNYDDERVEDRVEPMSDASTGVLNGPDGRPLAVADPGLGRRELARRGAVGTVAKLIERRLSRVKFQNIGLLLAKSQDRKQEEKQEFHSKARELATLSGQEGERARLNFVRRLLDNITRMFYDTDIGD